LSVSAKPCAEAPITRNLVVGVAFETRFKRVQRSVWNELHRGIRFCFCFFFVLLFLSGCSLLKQKF